jgi:hypothetical protein
MIQGWTPIKQKIVRMMGKTTMQIYGLHENIDFNLGGSSM